MSKVLVDVRGGVVIITINRPEVRNAIDYETSCAIADAIDEMEERSDIAVGILTGAGGTFSSGMDLKAFARGERPHVENRGVGGITQQLPSKPLIMAVEGWALAGGLELALAGDLIVAGRTAKLGLPEVRRGLVAGAGGLLRLPKLVSYSQAMRIALTGEEVGAEEAFRIGLVGVLVDDGEALAESMRIAAKIADNGPLAVVGTKAILTSSVGWFDEAEWRLMREVADPIQSSHDAREGALAFAEKRRPIWTGQ